MTPKRPKARIREIFVTTDLSPESTAAFEPARSLAEAAGARIVLATVVDSSGMFPYLVPEAPFPVLTTDLATAVVEARARTRAELARLAARLGPRCRATLVLEGASAASAILKAAEARRSSLIVLATHGRSGLRRLALGSTAEAVVRGAACPVLTVRAKARPARRRRT